MEGKPGQVRRHASFSSRGSDRTEQQAAVKRHASSQYSFVTCLLMYLFTHNQGDWGPAGELVLSAAASLPGSLEPHHGLEVSLSDGKQTTSCPVWTGLP